MIYSHIYKLQRHHKLQLEIDRIILECFNKRQHDVISVIFDELQFFDRLFVICQLTPTIQSRYVIRNVGRMMLFKYESNSYVNNINLRSRPNTSLIESQDILIVECLGQIMFISVGVSR